jgi:hypothetical protein
MSSASMPGTDHMNEREYNRLVIELGRRDHLRQIAALGLNDRMRELVGLLIENEVIPQGTPVLRESILHDG